MTDVLYEVRNHRAYLTLNRPDRLNAISDEVPGQLAAGVERANDDPAVKVIVLRGAGRAFCAGYDLKDYAEKDGQWSQGPVWDPVVDYRMMKRNTDQFFSLWRSLKPLLENPLRLLS